MIKLTLFFLLIAAFTAGCAPKSIDEYHTAENQEEITRLLNQREYGKAIWLIESRQGKMPADKNTAFLLGQAYLGKAGLEPLEVAAKVAGDQDFSSGDGKELLPSCPAGAVGPLKEVDPLCLLKRVYLHVPDADLEEMSRARVLFRTAYPDPASSPQWVNILVGMVETAGVVKRAGAIFLFAKHTFKDGNVPTDANIRWIVRQAKLILDESEQALARADHSGNKISQLLTGNSGTVWFKRATSAIAWADKLGFGNFFDLLRANIASPEDETRFGDTLDKIRSMIDEQEKRIAASAR